MQQYRSTSDLKHVVAGRPALHRRAGLAPLEFTLAAPMLVIMMALMINFGVAGAWKVRTQAATRYAAWRTVNERTGESNPPPPYWSTTAPLTTGGGNDLPTSSQLWDSQQELLCPCIRGQQLTAPNAQNSVNVPGRLEMDGFVLEGHAILDKPLPLLRTALPGGRFRFNLKQDVFDNQWQFYSLGIPWNDHIRATIWWDIGHSDLASMDSAIDSNKQLLDANLNRLQTSPTHDDLYPLDNDDEHARYYSTQAPDFYPRLGGGCESDPMKVYMSLVSRLDQNGRPSQGSILHRIDRLPCTMSQNFTSMYKSWICELEMCGFDNASIDPLRQRHKDLSQFLGSMGCGGGGNLTPCQCPPMTNCPCPPSPVGVGH
ncbi:MAG: pilus assembly protein [Planctomycetes bacterium]|nr:pilus assembly protein [Planctomycetota bacterium]